MITVTVKIKGTTPLSQGRYHETEKLEKESHDAYEKRTWPKKLHVDNVGQVFIPPTAFKNCLSEAAKYLGKQIPGKGKRTYTKIFESGVAVNDPVFIGVHVDDVEEERLFVPSDGIRGSGKRVMKSFPIIRSWNGTVTVHILDHTITQDVFIEHLIAAGQFIGVGTFRPANNGYFGRFEVDEKSVEWNER